MAKKSKYDGKIPTSSTCSISGFAEAMNSVRANPAANIEHQGLTQAQRPTLEDARDLARRRQWKPSPPSTAAMPFQIPEDRVLRQSFFLCAQYCGQEELKLRYGWMPHYDRIWAEVFGEDVIEDLVADTGRTLANTNAATP